MLKVIVMVVIGIFSRVCGAWSQVAVTPPREITSLTLQVCFNKTTNLIFPYSLRSIDRGSQDIIVQKAKGVDNVLQVKANRERFPETNISVITTDGRFYSFLVNYQDSPRELNFSFPADSGGLPSCKLTGAVGNDAEIKDACQAAIAAPAFMHLRQLDQQLRTSLKAIYLENNIMLLVLELNNRSMVGWTGQSPRLYIRDRHRPRRSAVQEREVPIIERAEDISVAGGGTGRFVLPISALTLTRQELLVVRINEVQGGRTVQLRIDGRRLLRARPLPQQ